MQKSHAQNEPQPLILCPPVDSFRDGDQHFLNKILRISLLQTLGPPQTEQQRRVNLHKHVPRVDVGRIG